MTLSDKYLICGIDPQLSLSSTGIAILDQDGKYVHYESINPSPLNGRARLYYIHKSLIRIFNSFRGIKVIAYERQISQQRYNFNASHILDLAENMGIVKLAIHESELTGNDLQVYGFTASEVKKFATGNSKAEKSQMAEVLGVRAMNSIKGAVVDYAVNDVVDAYHVARMAYSLVNKKIEGNYIEVQLA